MKFFNLSCKKSYFCFSVLSENNPLPHVEPKGMELLTLKMNKHQAYWSIFASRVFNIMAVELGSSTVQLVFT